MQKNLYAAIILGNMTAMSCQKLAPADFWLDFQKVSLAENISDQGPHGVHKAMYWNAAGKHIYPSKSILAFTVKNGWSILDSLEFGKQQVDSWKYNGISVFPLAYQGFTDAAINNSTFQFFPLWIHEDVKVYKFKTGWVTIDPGTEKSTNENGFVVVDKAGTQMSVYHLWGE